MALATRTAALNLAILATTQIHDLHIFLLDDAWRGRVYAVRYFTLFISAGIAIAMIALLHKTGGFSLVLGANSIVALIMFLATLGLVSLILSIESRHAASQPAE